MKLRLIIAFSFIGILLLSFRPATNPAFIAGHIRRNLKDTSAFGENLLVFVKGDDKVLAKAITDNKGDFSMTFTPGKEKSFDFFCTGVGIDTLLLASVTSFESDTREMTFYFPAQLKRSVLGKVICPKCRRTDKVYKIEYSIAPVVTSMISKSGDTTFSSLYKGTYQENCTAGPAKYYCDRDKVKF